MEDDYKQRERQMKDLLENAKRKKRQKEKQARIRDGSKNQTNQSYENSEGEIEILEEASGNEDDTSSQYTKSAKKKKLSKT